MLIDGITLAGSAQIIGIEREKSLTQPGVLAVLTGKARWYPARNITLVSVRAVVGTAPTGSNILINIKKNGVTVLSSPLVISVSQFESSLVVPTVTNIDTTDFLTVDVTQIGSTVAGEDLVVTIAYKTRNSA